MKLIYNHDEDNTRKQEKSDDKSHFQKQDGIQKSIVKSDIDNENPEIDESQEPDK